MTSKEIVRYSRQILLSELQLAGQQKLKDSSVLVIGAGGLGSPALFYLAAAGVGRIGVLDFDKVDESNLQRQILYSSSEVGTYKTVAAKSRLEGLNPFVKIEEHNCILSAENAMNVLEPYNLVVDGSDNLPTRYLVNDVCVLQGKPLIYGAIFQFEGQVSVFNEKLANGSRGPNYRDLFPVPPPPEMVPSCSVGGVLGVLPGIVGSMQANEAIKILAGMGNTLSGRLLLFDSLDFTIRFLNIKPNPGNPVSGQRPTITAPIDYEEFCNPSHGSSTAEMKEIEPLEVKKMQGGGVELLLLDVREPVEVGVVNIGALHIPLKNIEDRLSMIPRDIPVVVHCKTGARSKLAIEKLTKLGFTNLINMKGGIIRWIETVDPHLTKY